MKRRQELDSWQIGQRIQKARIQKGIKAIDMASQLDMSKNQYSRIECGESVCTTKVLHKVAHYLEISADYLLYGKIEDEYMGRINHLLQGKRVQEIEKMIQVLTIITS